MRVMIVEDGETQRQALAELLRDEGHDVLEASCPVAALEQLQSQAIDVLLLNYVSAGDRAPSLIERVRAVEDTGGRNHCDVVCISGASSVQMTADGPIIGDYKEACREAGAVAFFSKPVDFDRLSRFLADRKAAPVLEPTG